MCAIKQEFSHSLDCLSLWLEWKLTTSSPLATAVSQICWHKEGSTLTASSFRIWKSSTEFHHLHKLSLQVSFLSPTRLHIPGCPALGEWYIIVLNWNRKIFCVFLPPLLNSFCFSYVHTISVFYYAHFAWNFPLVSLTFLKRSVDFPILFISFIYWHWYLRQILSHLAILCASASRCVVFPFPFRLGSLLFLALCEPW